MIVLHNARIITMANPPVIESGSIAIDDGRIVDIQQGQKPGQPRSHIEYMDMQGKTILPALVNSHIHFTMWRSFGSIKEHRDTANQCIRAMRTSVNCLQKGITAARDMGHKDEVHLQLRNAIDEGLIEGPRIFSAGNAIVMSYGHAYFICNPVDDAIQLVAAIRQQVSDGCDFIKIIASNDDLWRLNREQFPVPWFSREDLSIASATAHEIGVPITAHANGIDTINRVIDADFDSLEHGIYLDDEAARKMSAKGMVYIPTMTGYKQNSDPVWKRGIEWTKRYAALWDVHLESVKHAVRRNVIMAAGTDTLGDMVEEMELMVLAGLSPLDAIRTASINGAKLIRLDDRIGSLEVGKDADLVVIDGNPMDSISSFKNVHIVFKRGKPLDPKALKLLLPDTGSYAQDW
jgi:imidazolonepropionase-like amidohydrolase